MVKCDCCGKNFYFTDIKNGATIGEHDDLLAETLCIKCNKMEEENGK